MTISRRKLLISAGAAAGAAAFARAAFAQAPPLAVQDSDKVGFGQTESNNPWRLAQTQSMQDEATSVAGNSSIPTPPVPPPSRFPMSIR